MTDTNGNVDPSHLSSYMGVLVSTAMLPDLKAAAAEITQRGFTFSIYLPDGGYRSWATQVDMHVHPRDHNLLPSPPAPPLAPVGYSRHGYGRAVDVDSSAPFAVVSQVMTKHHFTHWSSVDPPHWEWGNALQPAAVSITSLDNTPTPPPEATAMLRLVYGPTFVPAQPAATPPNGAGYYLVNFLTGKYIPVIGSQARCNILGAAIADPGTIQDITNKADFDWLIGQLSQLAALAPTGTGSTNDLEPVLAAVNAVETTLAGIKFPTKITGNLA